MKDPSPLDEVFEALSAERFESTREKLLRLTVVSKGATLGALFAKAVGLPLKDRTALFAVAAS